MAHDFRLSVSAMVKRVPALRIAPSLDKVPLVTFLAGLLFVVTPSHAQAPPDWMVCTGKVPAQPDRQVAVCTALIEAGRETAANLAVVYCSRGVAHQARDKLEPAIADYDAAARIAPEGATKHLCRGYGNLARVLVDDAITEFSEAIALDPSPSRPFLARGRAYRARATSLGQWRTTTRRSAATQTMRLLSTTAA